MFGDVGETRKTRRNVIRRLKSKKTLKATEQKNVILCKFEEKTFFASKLFEKTLYANLKKKRFSIEFFGKKRKRS